MNLTPDDWVILKCVGGVVIFILLFLAMNIFAMWLTTKDMTDEEKKSFLEYIEKNGLFGGTDDL